MKTTKKKPIKRKKARPNFYGSKIKEHTDPNAGSNPFYSPR